MIRSLWLSATGLNAQQTNMDVISNNLANVSTNGFKRQRAIFEDLLYQTIRQPGANSTDTTTIPAGLQLGTGVRPVAIESLHTQGTIKLTENSKDVAINGQGFFRINLPDGTTAYTRDGNFQVDQNGQMVTNDGYVLDDGITVPPNALSLSIGKDGTVGVTLPGTSQATVIGKLQLSTFINPTGLERMGENLYLETTASGAPNTTTPGLDGSGRLYQGYVENSNVNVATELVDMITTQRAFELNSKAVKASDDMLGTVVHMKA